LAFFRDRDYKCYEFKGHFRQSKEEVYAIVNYHLYLDKIRAGEKGLNPYLDHFNIAVADVSSGRAVFRMAVRPEYLQGARFMQGGLIVALADEAIAHAMMTVLTPEEGLTTIELKSNFLTGVDEGELLAEASVFKKGRSLIIGDCLVTDGAGKPVCRVSATFMLLRAKQK
jgi:uncharacterized protein (TIGR00369 family)